MAASVSSTSLPAETGWGSCRAESARFPAKWWWLLLVAEREGMQKKNKKNNIKLTYIAAPVEGRRRIRFRWGLKWNRKIKRISVKVERLKSKLCRPRWGRAQMHVRSFYDCSENENVLAVTKAQSDRNLMYTCKLGSQAPITLVPSTEIIRGNYFFF